MFYYAKPEHTFNYNVVEINDFSRDYKNESNKIIEHFYSIDKYNIGDTIRYEYTKMIDSTSDEAIKHKKYIKLMERVNGEMRLQLEAIHLKWLSDTVVQNKIKREKQQQEKKE